MTLLRNQDHAGHGGANETVPPEPRIRYEDDAYSWALQQAALLREGRVAELDLPNLADEVADVARREYDKLESALARLIQHLLKWDHQPDKRSRSWVLTIREQRSRVRDQLADHPGLRGRLNVALDRGYRNGRLAALRETTLPIAMLPELRTYDWDDIMTREITWPDD